MGGGGTANCYWQLPTYIELALAIEIELELKPFRFKQFTVHQDRCAMKVGTDGVLLGAWTSLENDPDSVLDIGTGTGLIALMMAQRSEASTIDAVELDPDAYEQCVANFEASPWGDRLFCYHAEWSEFVEEFAQDDENRYDLIVSNPPFHEEDVSSGDPTRDRARHNNSLPFQELLQGAALLLSATGVFCTIIPYGKEVEFIELAENFGLFPKRITRVRGNSKSTVKRSLLEFGHIRDSPQIDELVIEKERYQYTPEYIALTKDFYLRM